MPPKFPGATRRDFTRNRVKGPKFSGATRRNPTNRAKRPKIFRRYAPGDPPPDFPAHIQYVSTALFSNLGNAPATRQPDPATPGNPATRAQASPTPFAPLRDTASIIMFQIGETPPTGSNSGNIIAALRVNR